MDQSLYDQDNLKNCVVESPVPEVTRTEPCHLGIDEAGRGPVLGPMVYGICYSPLSEKDKLKELGLADSKTLSEEQRDDIFKKMCDCNDVLGWMIEILSPTFISSSMLRRAKYNLNALSHDCAIGLVKKALEKGANIAEVYVDTVGDPVKYQNKLKEIFPNIDITVAKKADSIYPIVSGASICAKVARDQAVKNWKFGENLPTKDLTYGSGYPGDAVTKQFLAGHVDRVFGFPQFVRISWSTASQILDKEAAPVKWEDDEDEVDMAGSASLLTFFQRSGDDHKHQKHKFFVDRCLNQMATL